jgi:hypothetical protein
MITSGGEKGLISRVVLVSCVKSKRPVASAAQDLYTSSLFIGMRKFAEQNSDVWFILSAEHGVLRPDDVIAPYERTLNNMSKLERDAWSANVESRLLELLPSSASIALLAGERYRERLVPFLHRHRFLVNVPMAGLKLGLQLRWLNEHTRNE